MDQKRFLITAALVALVLGSCTVLGPLSGEAMECVLDWLVAW